MFTKTLVSAALAISTVAVSGVADAETVYLGSPKGITTIRTSTAQTNDPYAKALPAERPVANKQIYVGGPKSSIPHVSR